MMSPEDLADEFEVLKPLVSVLPAGHPVRQRFELAARMNGDDGPPPARVLDDARSAFYRLPAAEQRRLLNGWTPCPDRMSRAYDDTPEGVALLRVLDVDVDADGRVTWGVQFGRHDSAAPVVVKVREGTSAAGAATALRRLADAIDGGRFEEMVGGRPPRPDGSKGSAGSFATLNGGEGQQKSRSPVTPLDPSTLGSSGISGAVGPTPAYA